MNLNDFLVVIGRVLKINRTFRDSNGREYTRVEFVRQSSVIDVYMKIRATKDEAFIRQFAAPDTAEKRRIMIEKRKIEGQLLRIKQKEQVLGMSLLVHTITVDTIIHLKLVMCSMSLHSSYQFYSGSKQGSNTTLPDVGCSNMPQEAFCTKTEMNGDVGPTSTSYIVPSSKKLCNSKIDPKRKCGACGNVREQMTLLLLDSHIKNNTNVKELFCFRLVIIGVIECVLFILALSMWL